MRTTSLPASSHNGRTLAALRFHTRDAHAALESADFVLPATRDHERYARLIGTMLAYHRAIEAEFRRYEAELVRGGITMHHRYRSNALESEAAALRSPAIAQPRVTFGSVAEAAGGVYVVEGSTLGGTLIGESIKKNLGHCSSYYGAFGAATAGRWRDTTGELEHFAENDGRVPDMLSGAAHAFATLHSHLERAYRLV